MEQVPFNFDVDWKHNPNSRPDESQFPDSDTIIDIEFKSGEWVAIYKPDDASEMYKRVTI